MRVQLFLLVIGAAVIAACGNSNTSANASDATGGGSSKTGGGSPNPACSCVYPFASECEASCNLRDAVVQSVNGDQITIRTLPKSGQPAVTETISIAGAKFNPADLKPGAQITISAAKTAPQLPKSVVLRPQVPIDPITHKLLPAGK